MVETDWSSVIKNRSNMLQTCYEIVNRVHLCVVSCVDLYLLQQLHLCRQTDLHTILSKCQTGLRLNSFIIGHPSYQLAHIH